MEVLKKKEILIYNYYKVFPSLFFKIKFYMLGIRRNNSYTSF